MEIARYLAERNLPTVLVMAPDPALDRYDWSAAPLLSIHRGRATEADAVGVTGAFAGIAETGTLMLITGADHPATLHLLPDTHIAVLRTDRIVAAYEDGWDLLRQAGGMLPRAVTFVTGPSRTADIEQRIELGAHGPRRLHIILAEP
jgi:L-lactate dehydrogenase complex protein LldG